MVKTIEHTCNCPLKNNGEITFPYSIAVRFRNGTRPYSFGAQTSAIHKGDFVVVETLQGLEMAQVEADAIDTEKYKLSMPQKEILRVASKEDKIQYENNISLEKEAFQICKEGIQQYALEMNLLSVQYNLDCSKILFIYAADQRVDFRELLKYLSSKLHSRIELRQIGDRDKAKMVGAIGPCGRATCCSSFKDKFDVISINMANNMAKNQNLALNIDKISGMCGKLKCCLKYEDEDYKIVSQSLPRIGSYLQYEGVSYRLSSLNIIREEARLDGKENTIYLHFDELRKAHIETNVGAKKKEPESALSKTESLKENKVITRSFSKKKENV